MTNKGLYTNVSIQKTGYVEVMPGQQIRYDFGGIGNNSTTSLTSFYWRDTLPGQAVRLDKIVTGTYNVPGNYKVVYKTNLSGGTWRTLADNLSTQQNYVLDASRAALGLASNEYVTEFMVSFGVVPANFRQVEAPQVYATVYAWLTGGSQFVNQADVGGVYNGQWIMATSRWVTRSTNPRSPCPAPAIDSNNPSSGGPPNLGGPSISWRCYKSDFEKKEHQNPAPGPGCGRPVRGPGLRVLLRRQRGGRCGADLDRRRRTN